MGYVDAGEIVEIERLQRAENQALMCMTPAERARWARGQLAYIASVEPDHWLNDERVPPPSS